ncbi:MAG: group II intron reverse transcriptase/maturase [Acidobacteria bacterium]|nr:MAG: group II intron reverse transcriptase/maturase [Acidobacteriota bacterium]
MPITAIATQDKVRELQRTLYRTAKADPGRRFHALYDKVHRRDVLERAWELVRRNRGAAGIDRKTIAEVEQFGVDRMLAELARELRDGSYRALPARRVFIPKPGTRERRPLSIPTVRDRVVQAATKIAIEPIFEADFLPCSWGFRPRRTAHDALQVLLDESFQGARWVVEADIASCFEEIPHERLMAAIEERVCDRKLLKLLRAMLRAGVMEQGAVRRRDTGTPQGGVISPLLANVYLHRLDRQWADHRQGVPVRYADDLVVICRSQSSARRALAALRAGLEALGLRIKEEKTRIVHLREGGEGFDFLGFHHRWVRAKSPGNRHVTFLARWPSRRAMKSARERIREITARKRLALGVETIVRELNWFLRGWGGYFRHGNSTIAFDKVKVHAIDRLARFVAIRHQRSVGWGWVAVVHLSPDLMGLYDLQRTVKAPRPVGAGRRKPNAAGEARR